MYLLIGLFCMRVSHTISLTFDRGTLILTGLPAHVRPNPDGHHIWRWDDRVRAWRTEAIHYATLMRTLHQRFGPSLTDHVSQPARVRWPRVHLPKLRPEQAEAVTAWTKAGARGQVIMPTGTGKTEVALAIMAQVQVAIFQDFSCRPC